MIQLSGDTPVNTTFTCSSGTRREIVDGVVAALVSAGWTIVSGSGTGDVVIKNVATPTIGNQGAIRIYDPGSGNYANFRLRDVAGSYITSNDHYLKIGVGKVFRVIACQYQFFVTVDGSNVAGDYLIYSAIYIPTHNQATISRYLILASNTDNGGTGFASFRTDKVCKRWSILRNTNPFDGQNTNDFSGHARIIPIIDLSSANGAYPISQRYEDGSYLIGDALISSGVAGGSLNAEGLIAGQLWNSFIDTASRTLDTEVTYDDGQGARTYKNIGGYNGGNLWTAIT